MKHAITAIATVALAGCTSLNQAGNSAYTVRPYAVPGSGAVLCCELQVQDGKEYSSRTIEFKVVDQGYSLKVDEGESKAFRGQGIAAKAATVFPVNLGDILK